MWSRWRWTIAPGLATLAIALAATAAWRGSTASLASARWLATVPHATLAAPVRGPAIYAGKLFAAIPRTTPLGTKVAAYWWWVDERKNKEWKNVCREHARAGLELRDGDARAAVAMLDAPSLALFADTLDDDFGLPLVVDLGALGREQRSAHALPDARSGCAGDSRAYTERWIPQGAAVEVLACADGATLRPCDGLPLQGVLGAPTLAKQRERRVEEAARRPRIVVAASGLALLLLGVYALVARAAALRPLSPARGAR